ncbi:hypothetical protein G9A89_018523 [Geosiphon pyriformis]|nr:hypothetical protein G9A89_018523 [Geosiphon pyriformis]
MELVGSGSLSVYMDRSLKDLGTIGCKAGTATFFKDINLGLDIGVLELLSSTMAELQAIVLALECVPLSCSVHLFSDSQSALDVCKSELGLVCSDFRNQYWIKHQHIVNIIHNKNLQVSWHKVKDHSGISRNEHTNIIANAAFLSDWCLPSCLDEYFIVADSNVVSGNSKHFVHDVYHSVCHVYWEFSASMCTYFIKALYYQLPVAIQKCLYDKHYPSVLCLYCGNVEVSDYVFFCELLSFCVSNFSVSMALYKSFVFDDWFCKAVFIFYDLKIASLEVVKFVHSFGLTFKEDIWIVYAKHRAYMEKAGLILLDGLAFVSIFSLTSGFSAGVIKLLDITKAFGICFGINNMVSIHITA